jgi:hypothetical protein
MAISERDMTRLSLLMASLVSSPAQANDFIVLVRKNGGDAAFASVIEALRSQIDASAGQAVPSLDTLRETAQSLVAQNSESAVAAGRLLASALENRR